MSSFLSMQSSVRLRAEIIGVSKEAERIRRFAQRSAHMKDTLFIRGESGAGKDHLAEYIHSLGYNNQKFVPIDCGSMPENLCESELFGYSAGAFTDARKAKQGLIQVANKGTLFLNEVANMGSNLQVKFLRLLDTKTFRLIGGTEEIPMNTRIIAATNAEVEELVKSGKLRADLYHRLNVITFNILPLRERLEDIPYLVEHFLRECCSSKKFSSAAIGFMNNYLWPGNIRELKHVVERAVFSSDAKEFIEIEDFENSLIENKGDLKSSQELQYLGESQLGEEIELRFYKKYGNQPFPKWEDVGEELLKMYLLELLKKTGGNQSMASMLSGLTRGKIRERMKKFNISINSNVNYSY